MNVCIVVDRERYSIWHTWLVADLKAAGHSASVVAASRSSGWPVGLAKALRLDRMVHSLSGAHAMDSDIPGDLRPEGTAGPFDVAIDCSGSHKVLPEATRTLRLLFNGVPSELGIITAVLNEKPFEVALRDERSRGWAAVAYPAVPSRRALTDVLNSVLARAVELIVQCVSKPELRAAVPAKLPGSADPLPESASVGGELVSRVYLRLGGILATKVARKLSGGQSALGLRSRWALAIRPKSSPGICRGDWPTRADFSVVRDDGQRFYADPMLIEHEGRTWLFCEEFPFATARGIISVAEICGDGSVSAMRPVLERPYHLSYPFVFRDKDEFWLIPESGSSGAVELYRATEFPYVWKFERNIIDGIAAYDVTALKHSGHYFLLLTTAHRKSTTCDNLRIFEADSLDGPFVPHAMGVAMIDCTQSRSAGAVFQRGADVLRPVQDCSQSYGGGLGIARIDRLTSDTYAQTLIARLRPVGNAAITGIHTYTESPRFEAVDIRGEIDDITHVTIAVDPV